MVNRISLTAKNLSAFIYFNVHVFLVFSLTCPGKYSQVLKYRLPYVYKTSNLSMRSSYIPFFLIYKCTLLVMCKKMNAYGSKKSEETLCYAKQFSVKYFYWRSITQRFVRVIERRKSRDHGWFNTRNFINYCSRYLKFFFH